MPIACSVEWGTIFFWAGKEAIFCLRTMLEPMRNGLSAVTLRGPDYATFGELIAWRLTFWDGDQQVAEQKSFLW